MSINGTNISVSQLASDHIAGACFLVTSLCGLCGYALVLPAIVTSKGPLKHPCYVIMFSLGVSDCISLLCWFLLGLYTVTHGGVVSALVIKHCLCILVVGWGSLTAHIAVLGVNRYIAVCKSQKQHIFFSPYRMRIIIAVCWLYAIFVHGLPTFLPPNMTFSLDGYMAGWESSTVTEYYFVEDITWCTSVFCLDLCCYSMIIHNYRKIRKQFPTLPSKAVDNRIRQFRLALQCMIRCVAFYSYDVLYYCIGYITENFWLTFICSTYLWAFNNALSPWLYLTFDRQLRGAVRKWFAGNKTHPALIKAQTIWVRSVSLKTHNRVYPQSNSSV